MTSRHAAVFTFALASLCATSALAQPANDTCAGALPLTFSGQLATSSVVTGIDLAAAAAESPMSCTSSIENTVWFSFVAPATGSFRVQTCGLANYDTVLAIYTGACGGLTQVTGACNDEGGTGCTPQSAVTLSATSGTTYYVQVAAYSTGTPLPTHTLQLQVAQQQPPGNDSCGGALPQLQLNRPFTASTAGDLTTLNAVNDAQLPGDGGCLQGIGNTNTSATGSDVAVNFRAPATGQYSFRVGRASTTPNTVVYLADSCLGGTPPITYNAPVCVAAANRNTSAFVEELSCVDMTANQTLTLWVDQSTSTTSFTTYPIEVAACFPENENNDTTGRANALACPLTGSINPAGDVDFFSLGTYPGARVYAMVEGNATSLSDFDLRVTTATDTLEYDDANGTTDMGSNSAVIAGTVLPNAPAFLRTNYNSATTAQGPYRLHAMVKFGAPTAELEPNGDAGAANDLGLFVTGDIPDTTDTDFYAFEAREGDLVFLAVDSSPTRAAATVGNHNIQVLAPDFTQIALTSDTGTTATTTPSPGTLTGTTPNFSSEGFAFRATATGRHYARINRTSATGTGTYTLAISINCGYVQPTLASVTMADGGTPASGSIIGGDELVLTGSGFNESSTVTIGGGAATVTARTSTSLTVTTPGGTEGSVNVGVTNFGNLTSTLGGAFTYISPAVPPTITSVTPGIGPADAGTAVTLVGTFFKPGAEVTFTVGAATAPATNVVVINATQLTCTTPALGAGQATVTVRNPVDDLSGSLPNAFTFVPPPTYAGVSPAAGLTTGGQGVTITGTGFLAGATVLFGSTPGTNVVVASDGLSLTVTAPAATSSGAVTLTVRNTDGQQAQGPGAFTYVYPAPTLSNLTPRSGFAAGGQTVTIDGTGFLTAPVPTVTFGGTAATGVVRVNATRLTAITPAGAPGAVDVVVTNNDGQAVTSAAAFTYIAAPTVASISPARGPSLGGTRVTITGANFVPGAQVTIAGVPAFAPTVVNATTISVVTNAGPAGTGDVVVRNPDTQTGTLPASFTYDPAPTLVALTPGSGSTAGGTVVTLTGTGFRAGAVVLFGSDAATAVSVVSGTELMATTPAHGLGVVTVVVRNDDQQSASLARAFRFVAPPTLTAASPATGDVSGRTTVRLTGTHFDARSTVTFGGTPAESVAFISATALDAVTPAHAPGDVDVVVTNPNGDSATLANGFRFTRSAPTIGSVVPASGFTAGGAQVSIIGTGFASGASVTFGGAAATGVVVASPELLRAVAPAHAAGAVDVVVTNDDQQAATLANGFTYVEATTGNSGLVTDGGDGALVSEVPDAGTGNVGTGGGGCGCASVDASMLAPLALGALALLRRRRRVR